MTWTPPPGTIGLTYSYGFTAFRATLGQSLTNSTNSYSHAFIVLSDEEVMEPWPNGARITDIRDYEGEYVAYGFLPDLSEQDCLAIASSARSLDGTRHGLKDYLALAAHRFGSRRHWVLRRLASPRRLLPAQFVAETYRRAGLELMPGFDPGDVTLEDVGQMLLSSREWELRTPYTDFGRPRRRYAG